MRFIRVPGNVIRDAKAGFRDGVDAADVGVVVRKEYAGRPVRDGEKLFGCRITTEWCVILAGADVLFRDLQTKLFTGPVKAHQTGFRYGGAVSMNIGYPPVSMIIGIIDQRENPVHIVGKNRGTVVESVVKCHSRDVGKNELLNLRIMKIRTDDAHAVKLPEAGMLQISCFLVSDVAVDKGDIITAALGLETKAVQCGGKIFMHETAALKVFKQQTDVVGAVGLECAGSGVGGITHFFRGLSDPLPGLLADILLVIQGLADCGDRHAAACGNVF